MVDLLGLADALPPGLRVEDSPSLSGKVLDVDRALDEADLPHAIGGALAFAYYGEPRATLDIDVNVFIPVDRWPRVADALARLVVDFEVDGREITREKEARLLWDRNPIHLFFSHDELHAAMPAAVRRVPFAGSTIPIVSPEHLVARKILLDRSKDWLDIEAIFVAETPLDLKEIRTWVERLAGRDDPRLARLAELTTPWRG